MRKPNENRGDQIEVDSGLIEGATNRLMPDGRATRAQTAMILYRLFG